MTTDNNKSNNPTGHSNFDWAGDATTTDTIGHSISIFELAAEEATSDTMCHSNLELAGDATTTDNIGHSIRFSNWQQRKPLLILCAI
jgi:hypothetical protein